MREEGGRRERKEGGEGKTTEEVTRRGIIQIKVTFVKINTLQCTIYYTHLLVCLSLLTGERQELELTA